MKGTDVTPEQLAHAEIFLKSANGGRMGPQFMQTQKYLTIDKADIIRLLAWYGAIRAKNGNVNPGRLVTRASDMSAAALECGAALKEEAVSE